MNKSIIILSLLTTSLLLKAEEEIVIDSLSITATKFERNFDKIEGKVQNGWMKSSSKEVSAIRSDK